MKLNSLYSVYESRVDKKKQRQVQRPDGDCKRAQQVRHGMVGTWFGSSHESMNRHVRPWLVMVGLEV